MSLLEFSFPERRAGADRVPPRESNGPMGKPKEHTRLRSPGNNDALVGSTVRPQADDRVAPLPGRDAIYPEFDAQLEASGCEAGPSRDADDFYDEGIGCCDEGEFPDDELKPWTMETYNMCVCELRRFDRIIVEEDESV